MPHEGGRKHRNSKLSLGRGGSSGVEVLRQQQASSRLRSLESDILNQSNFGALEERFGSDLADKALKAFTDPGTSATLPGASQSNFASRFSGTDVQVADLISFLEDPRFTGGDLGSKGRGRLAGTITQERIATASVAKRVEEESTALAQRQSLASERLIRIETQQQRRQQAGGLRSGILTSPRGLSGANLRLGT